ncbi:MAG: dihydropteroate synthase [Pseudolabrys sp.]
MMRRNARMKRDVFLADIGTRPLIMGILNVTPDSFFDGGRYTAGGATLARVRQMVVDGCDIVDIGAESTRPEAQAIDEAEELTRLDRVLEEIATLDVRVSIVTTKSAVAARACPSALFSQMTYGDCRRILAWRISWQRPRPPS